jgi:hypothetical protein
VSGKSSRDKGKRGEREFAGLVNNYLGYQAFERNIGQTRAAGADKPHRLDQTSHATG